MTWQHIGRVIRALRHRRGWTQTELGRVAGCSASAISRIERGQILPCSVSTLERIVATLDARLVTTIQWRGGELDRLLDADHAALQEQWAGRKRQQRPALESRQEVTYNHYGERGSIDDLAYDAASRTLIVTEIKTAIYHSGNTLAKLDEKERLARGIARRFGWIVERVVPCLVVAETRTNRRRIDEHAAAFARFDCRGHAANRWLRDPSIAVRGLLIFEKLPSVRGAHARRAGRQRIRHPRREVSVGETGHAGPGGANAA